MCCCLCVDYNTKYVAVPDTFLSKLHKIFMLTIVIYVFAVLVFLNKGCVQA